MRAIFAEYREGIVLPRVEKQCLLGVARIFKRLTEELHRQPTIEEIAAAPDLPKEMQSRNPRVVAQRIRRILAVIGGRVEIDAPRSDQATLQDMIGVEGCEAEVEASMTQAARRAALERALQMLGKQQRRVLINLYLKDIPRSEWGPRLRELGLTRRQVWRAYGKGKKRMKELGWLKEYL